MEIEKFADEVAVDIENFFMRCSPLTHENLVKTFEDVKALVKLQLIVAYQAGTNDLGDKLSMTRAGRKALEEVGEE